MIEQLKRMVRANRLRRRFPTCRFQPGATVDAASSLGDYAVLFRDAAVLDSSVGAYTYVQAGSALYNAEVGPFCSIAAGVTIGIGAHPTHMVATSPVFYDNQQPLPRFFTRTQVFKEVLPRTVIGADVWIGQGAMVKAGVRIGPGSVIGANAVVTRDVPPYTVAAGVPCRPIRGRFAEDICRRLLASRWWEYSESRLAELTPSFADPEAFLRLVEGKKS